MGTTCLLTSFLKPLVQVLVTAGADTGLAFGITAAFTFLFLFGHHDLCQVVAVLRSKDTADLAVLPEEALAAGIRLVIVVSDPIDQNGFAFRFFSHHDILHSFDPPPGKSGDDKSPAVIFVTTGLCKISII